MSCHQSANTDSWLSIVSRIVSAGSVCTVGGHGRDRHEVNAENYSLLNYKVDVKGDCLSPCVNYSHHTNGLQSSWTQTFDLPAAPGKRGPMKRSAACALKSLGAATYQNIQVDVTWTERNFPFAYSDRLSAQVTTL